MQNESRDFDTPDQPTLPASPLPAVCASDAATSQPAGAPQSFAPEFLDYSVDEEPLGEPEYLPTLKERHVDKERICPTGKVPFLTASAAEAMLKTFKRRQDEWREKGRHLMMYHCRKCQRYHIGNSANFESGWDKRERKRRPRNLPHKHRKENRRGRRKSD